MELGSNFQLDLKLFNSEKNQIEQFFRNKSYILFNSGRNAIRYLCSLLPGGDILLPDYICSSVTDIFLENKKFNIKFYKINPNFSIDVKDLEKKISKSTSTVFIMHYFGIMQNEIDMIKIKKICLTYKSKLVEDLTHSIFSQGELFGDYFVCSLRKWFPVPDGGVLFGDKLEDKTYSRENVDNISPMILKQIYLKNNINYNNLYRNMFIENENYLNNFNEIKKISLLSENLLMHYNFEKMIEIRQKNAKYLISKLYQMGFTLPYKLKHNNCFLSVPIMVKERDKLRRYLINNNIFCAVHWPENNNICVNTKYFSEHELSLPIDQRYGKSEMDYLINKILEFGEVECLKL